eukprot:scaffold129046_cov27-Tisochrysis_lutea.AAC.1
MEQEQMVGIGQRVKKATSFNQVVTSSGTSEREDVQLRYFADIFVCCMRVYAYAEREDMYGDMEDEELDDEAYLRKQNAKEAARRASMLQK